jgi:acid phosphatase family membrane protein YuiD
LVNKAMLVLVLIFGVLVGSGLDVAQLGSSLLSREASAGEIVSSGASSAASSSQGFSLSITGPGGWKNAIVLVAVIFTVTIVALSVLSASGRDAAHLKEREAKLKEEEKCMTAAKAAVTIEPGSEECNLASYKLFYPSPTASTDGVPAEKAGV